MLTTVAIVAVSGQEHPPAQDRVGVFLAFRCAVAQTLLRLPNRSLSSYHPAASAQLSLPLALQVRKRGAKKGGPVDRQFLPWEGILFTPVHPCQGYLQPSPPALLGQEEWDSPYSTPKCMTRRNGACSQGGTLCSNLQLPNAKCHVFPMSVFPGALPSPPFTSLLSWGL